MIRILFLENRSHNRGGLTEKYTSRIVEWPSMYPVPQNGFHCRLLLIVFVAGLSHEHD